MGRRCVADEVSGAVLKCWGLPQAAGCAGVVPNFEMEPQIE
jgi:hypothetical protein